MSYLHNRFRERATKLVRQYVASIPFDQRLYRQDIKGSIAHVKILRKQGITAKNNAKAKEQKLDFWRIKNGN